MQALNISAFSDMSIRLILFDLGGVLYNIEHARTHSALQSLQSAGADPIAFSLEHANPIFAEYDAGRLNTKEFISGLRDGFSMQATDDEIINAWNAMLLGLYPDSLAFIEELKKRMPIALLSNINQCHHEYVKDECDPLFKQFHHVFLSYEIQRKKPDPDIFHHVISSTGYEPGEILFLDDTPINCSIAQSLGIQSKRINPHSREWLQEINQQFL